MLSTSSDRIRYRFLPVFLAFLFMLFGGFVSRQSIAIQDADYEHANLSFYHDKNNRRKRVTSVADWKSRRAEIIKGFEKASGKFPADRKQVLQAKIISKKSFPKFERQTLRIQVKPDPAFTVDLYLPHGLGTRDKKTPAVLALHPTGAAGRRIIGGESPKANRQYANELAERGYVVIAPDYPSFGDSRKFDFKADRFPSGTMRGIVNHVRCVDFLQQQEYVDGDRIAVIGHSLGGHNAIFAALFDERLKVVVTSCGWTPFHDYYGGNIRGWTSDRYLPRLKTEFKLEPDQVPFDFYELVAALAPRPFLTSSPIDDSNFDVRGVKKAIPKIRQVYSLYSKESGRTTPLEKQVAAVYPPCGHDFPSEIREQAYTFIDQALNFQPATRTGFKSELPRIKPLDVAEALKSFSHPEVSLVAAEPDVVDPIAMAFDSDQRLFVVEMIGYSEQGNERLGRIRLLEDVDQDGRYEKSTVYAKGLSWPTAIICSDGGIFVGAAPDILFLKDEDGDSKAEIRRKVFTGFGRHNVQGLLNSFRWGLDNRIHGATSSCGGTVHRVGNPETAINLRGRDFSFDPRKLDLRAETGGAQHGMCFDDWGRKYVCSNSDHAQMIRFDDRYLARNPNFNGIPARKSIATDGGQAPVFRNSPVEPWRIVRTRLRVAGKVTGPVEGGGTAAGYFTGSTGMTIFRGDANVLKKGTAIIGDVGSNIVHRKQIRFDGLQVSATRIDTMSEFLTSSDNWFRPVQFGNSPDGTLWILDMYREVIEHPKSLPPEIKRHLDLTSGRDRGRIYRLGKPKLNRKHRLNSQTSTRDLVKFLNHENSWHRETASRILFERQDITAIQFLQTVRVHEFGPQGRMHALYALSGLKQLKLDDLMIACLDSHPQVRLHAIRLAEKTDPRWLMDPAIRKLADDPNPEVRLQLAFSIGACSSSTTKTGILWRLLRKYGNDPLMFTGIMSSANPIQLSLLEKAIQSDDYLSGKLPPSIVNSLVRQIVHRKSANEIEQLGKLIQTFLDKEQIDRARKLVLQFGEASAELKTSLRIHAAIESLLDQEIANAKKKLEDASVTLQAKLDLFPWLRFGNYSEVADTLLRLISIRQPVEIQLQAIDCLCSFRNEATAESLIAIRRTLSRKVREQVTRQLMSRTSWARRLLESSRPGDIPPGVLQIASQSRDAATRARAKKLLAEVSSKKAELLKRYRKSLSLLGDPRKGKSVFQTHCSKCHQADQIGHEIGPNLAAMKARGKAAILTNVLDPNREVNPAFLNYIVNLEDGRSLTGMIKSESNTTVVLQQPENKTISLRRSEIEQMKNSGLSFMPEGLEKEITTLQMADLLEFLMTAK